MAQTTGRAVLRLAEADVLPFEFARFASTVETYLDQVTDLVETMRDDTQRQNRLVQNASYELAADPTQAYLPPPEEEPVPYLNFAPLRNAVADLRMQADAYGRAIEAWTLSPVLDVDTRAALNQILIKTERALTNEVSPDAPGTVTRCTPQASTRVMGSRRSLPCVSPSNSANGIRRRGPSTMSLQR